MGKMFHVENGSSDELNVFVYDNDNLHISVTEEKAMDSYNQDIECTIVLNKEEAIKLRDFLISFYEK